MSVTKRKFGSDPVKPVYQADRNSDMWDIVRHRIGGLDTDAYIFDKYSILKVMIDAIEDLSYFDLRHEDYVEFFELLRGCEDFRTTIDKSWAIMMKDRIYPYHESVYQIMTLVSEMLFILNDNQDSFPFDVLLISRASSMCAVMTRNSHHNFSYDTELYAEQSTIGLWRSIGRYYMEANGATLEQKRDAILVLDIAYRNMKRLMDATPNGETKDLHKDGFEWLEESVTTRKPDGTFDEDETP